MIRSLLRRLLSWTDVDSPLAPPFDLVFGDAITGQPPEKVITEGRLRVGVFRPKDAPACQRRGRRERWLAVELRDEESGRWELVIVLQESRLRILLSVLRAVQSYLESGGQTPTGTDSRR